MLVAIARVATAGMAIVCLPACSARELVDDQRLELAASLIDPLNTPAEQRSQDLTWDDAVGRLLKDAPALTASATAVCDARDRLTSAYLNPLPTIELRASATDRINDLSDQSLRFDAFAFALLSGVIDQPRRVFIARLALIRATATHELTRRQLITELHAAFLTWELLTAREQLLDAIDAVPIQSPPSRAPATTANTSTENNSTAASLRETLAAEQRQIQDRLSELLGDPIARFRPLPTRVPMLDPVRITSLATPDRIASSLEAKLLATEVVAARAGVLGALLALVPEPRLFATVPTLYTRTAAGDSNANLEDTLISAQLSLRIDTSGNAYRNLRRSRRARTIAVSDAERRLLEAVLAAQDLAHTIDQHLSDADRASRDARLAERAAPLASPEYLPFWADRLATLRTQEHRARLEANLAVTPLLAIDGIWEDVYALPNTGTDIACLRDRIELR